MSFTETLLRLSPQDAIVAMLNEENQTAFPNYIFKISPPTVVSGKTTKVTLTTRKSASKLDEIPYQGTLDFTYERLPLDEQFAGVLTSFRPQLPCSTQTVLDELTRLTGQQFYLDDIVHEEIDRSNAAPYVLKAKSESLRWIGSLTVTLIDLIDLNDFFDDNLEFGLTPRLGSFNTTPQLTSPVDVYPTLNATHVKHLLPKLVLNENAQEVPEFVEFVKRTVPVPGQAVDFATSPWHVSATPGPFNLYNAKVRNKAEVMTGVNRMNSDLNRAVVIELSPTHCTNFADPWLAVPYADLDFGAVTNWTDQPRLTRFAVKSIIDGSTYSAELYTIQAGFVFEANKGRMQYTFNAYGPWTVTEVKGKKSLTDAVVLYNGQRRPTDNEPADPTLNRVLSAVLSDHNTGYRGSFAIHHRAPIMMIDKMPNGRVSYNYSVNFNPTGGQGPYTITLLSGSFAPGHVFNAAAATVEGMATATGTFKPVLKVRDANGIEVVYSYQYTVTALPLSVTGQAPDGKVGESYSYAYQIEGGYKPYKTLLESGSLPFGVTLDQNTAVLTGSLLEAGHDEWVIWVVDAKNNSVRLSDDMLVR